MKREQLLMIAAARNEYSGHKNAEDPRRLRILKSDSDADVVKKLNETLVQDFGTKFDGRGVEKAPKLLSDYMASIGLGSSDEEEELEVDTEEEEVEVDGGDDELNLDALGDDDGEAVEVEDAGDVEIDLDDDGAVTVDVDEPAAPAPAAKPREQQTTEYRVPTVAHNADGSSNVESVLLTIMQHLAEGCEIVIRAKTTVGDIQRNMEPAVASTVRGARASKAATPQVEESTPARAPRGQGQGTRRGLTPQKFATSAKNTLRKILREKVTADKMRARLAETWGVKIGGRGKKTVHDLSGRALMSLLLKKAVTEASAFAKANPDKSKTRAHAAEWVSATLKDLVARAKSRAAAKK